jgi:hypothetical protein
MKSEIACIVKNHIGIIAECKLEECREGLRTDVCKRRSDGR